jgi:hypothetical protein
MLLGIIVGIPGMNDLSVSSLAQRLDRFFLRRGSWSLLSSWSGDSFLVSTGAMFPAAAVDDVNDDDAAAPITSVTTISTYDAIN